LSNFNSWRITRQYKAYSEKNYRTIPQIQQIPEEHKQAIAIVSKVLPFETNNYVVDNLIDWSKYADDPMFILTFPQRDMLRLEHYKI
jgi:L-lysine 2,3-aminomutase